MIHQYYLLSSYHLLFWGLANLRLSNLNSSSKGNIRSIAYFERLELYLAEFINRLILALKFC